MIGGGRDGAQAGTHRCINRVARRGVSPMIRSIVDLT
jgi:hypothetical protein